MSAGTVKIVADLEIRDDIAFLVRAFYRHAAVDHLLEPIFDAAKVDWVSHIETLTDFWAWQLLGERGYSGNPLLAHRPIHDRTPFEDRHYERWLELFLETVDEHFGGPNAEIAKGRAIKMANAMQRLLGGVHGAPTEPMQPMWVPTSQATPDVS